ncbi:ASZ1 [Symbiodinium sp. KB8]|nr:ASZ1 [Symbiodinium sp. KB8]
MWAAGSGHFDAVELLTHHGANFDPWVLDVFTGALLSVLLVLGTRYLKGLPMNASVAKIENYLPVELNRKRGFSRGAQLLIGKARLPWALGVALYTFRSVEVVTNLVAILGSGMMIVWWPCWLPFVIGGFLAPTLHKNYAVNLTKPVLITAVKDPLSALLALLRTFLFGSVAMAIAAPSTFWTGWINLEQAQAQVKMHSDWTEEPTQLQANLGRIFEFFISSVLLLVALYATSLASYLLWFVVRRFVRKQPGAHQAGQLVEADSSFQEDMLGQILAALPEERSWPSEAKPEVLWQPERFFDSMVVKLSLHLLAVVMDINTIFTMASSQRYILSLLLTTLVTQIFVKEILYGSPMKFSHVVRQSAQRGILREDLLKLLEDKASISVLSLVLTTYSFYFCVQAPFQAMALLFSIVLNVYAVTGFIFEQIDLDLQRAGEDSLPRTGRALISL